jgi:hypothetical protein
MADQDPKSDVQEDGDDTAGHKYPLATPDEDAEARLRAARQPLSKPEDDDTEGHFLKK